MRRILGLALVLAISCAKSAPSPGVGSLSPAQWPTEERDRYLGMAQNTPRNCTGMALGPNGAVTVAYGGFAARAGLEALKQGGNAIDAALTTALTQVSLTAGAPISYFGILSLVYYDAKTGAVATMNAPWNTIKGEAAPLTIPGGLDLSDDSSPRHCAERSDGASRRVHERRGGCPSAFWALALCPSFRTSNLRRRAGYAGHERPGEPNQNASRRSRAPSRNERVFTKADGSFYQEGDLFRQPALARTLRTVAAQGADYMYWGPWAKKLVTAVAADGGKMTLEDLANYAVIWGRPIIGPVGDYEIYTAGTPNYGGVGMIEAQQLAVAAGLAKEGHWSQSGTGGFLKLRLMA